MAGLGKQGKTKARRRSVDMAAETPKPAWYDAWAASDPQWEESDAYALWVDSDDIEAQMFHRVRRDPDTNRVVDFAIGIQIRECGSDEGWVEVSRADCAHGQVHLDINFSNGDSEKDYATVPEVCREDLDKAHAWAVDYFWNYQERLRGWI